MNESITLYRFIITSSAISCASSSTGMMARALKRDRLATMQGGVRQQAWKMLDAGRAIRERAHAQTPSTRMMVGRTDLMTRILTALVSEIRVTGHWDSTLVAVLGWTLMRCHTDNQSLIWLWGRLT